MKVAVHWALFQKASVSSTEMTFRIKPGFASLVFTKIILYLLPYQNWDQVNMSFLSLSHLIITDKSHSYKGSAQWQIFTLHSTARTAWAWRGSFYIKCHVRSIRSKAIYLLWQPNTYKLNSSVIKSLLFLIKVQYSDFSKQLQSSAN